MIENPIAQKIIIFSSLTALAGALSFIVYKEIQSSKQQTAIDTQFVAQKQLLDNIVRAQSQYASKQDILDFAKVNNINLKTIQDDMDKLHASLTAVNSIVVSSKSQSSTNISSTSVGPKTSDIVPDFIECKDGEQIECDNKDNYGYFDHQQDLALSEDFGDVKAPIGSVHFSAWREKPWSIDLSAREYHVTTVLGEDQEHRAYVYSKFNLVTQGQTISIPITSSTTLQEVPSAKFSWWNPRAFLTAGASLNLGDVSQGSMNIGATIGVMSYGRYTVTPDISLLAVGLGYQSYTKSLSFIINPLNFNVSAILPGQLAKNTYFGPSLQITTTGNVFAGLNLSLGF